MSYNINWSKKADKFLDKIKLRVGDYRVLVDINTASKLIEVRVVGHRGNIYKTV